MPAKPIPSPDTIEMSSVLRAVKKSLPKILLVCTTVGALTYGVLMMVAPKYLSQTEMAIEAKGASGLSGDPKATQAGPDSLSIRVDKEAINTHVRALQSTDLLSQISADLKLEQNPEFNGALGPVDMVDRLMRLVGIGGPRAGESDHDRVLNTLRNQIEVYSAKESRYIGIRATAMDPALAADIANKLADLYRSSLANQSVSEIDDQQNVMQAKIEKLTPEVAAVETEVERYRGEINSFKGGTQNTGLNEQQLSDLTAELTRAKAARGEADARSRSAREMMKAGSADALPDVQKSPLIQALIQQRVRLERQISELSASLLPGHPRMRQLSGELAGLKAQIAAETAKIVDGLDKEARVAQGREDSIKKSLDELKTKVVNNAPEEAKLRQLEAGARAKRTELESLQAQLEANRKKLDARAQPVEAQIISRAQASSVPYSPKKGQTAALVSAAALLFGIFWSVTKALFVGARGDISAPAARMVVKTRPEPTLAGRAETQGAELSPPGVPAAATKSDPITSLPVLASRIVDHAPANGGHRTLVTGDSDAVDAGPQAVGLAKAISEHGVQVILVDWSPLGRSIAELVGTDGGKGLSELLLGEVTFEGAVKRVAGSTVHVIDCGMALGDALHKIDPDHLNLVLDALDEAYDHIIVTGAREEARLLFEAIQGRFDAGVVVADPANRAEAVKDQAGVFLGFEVADIDVIRFERPGAKSPAATQRMRRTTPTKSGAGVPAG